ncbi:uncharacterized protein B0T23DRAFT_446245 [Neurospora hispaniola]|uniref:Uncharacterized protein n=1 Tax=Neurospora hispaniola TaxID=588809 RepID=A0AAJ0I1C8_9PEZI|nr:hypothetical protein B0T23DRAFT_446245 [Neurospora hispaniola]
MADDSEPQDSKLSTAANIVGLLTFTLAALNLVIVRVLQNERSIVNQLRKRGWRNSLNALEQKIRYIRLFNPSFVGFGRDQIHAGHASGERSGLEDKQPEERLSEIFKDVQNCYDQGKVNVNETEAIENHLAEQISPAGYARATRRLISQWDVEGFYEASMSVWRQLYNRREAREAAGKLEENYQELSSIVADVDSHILLIQGLKILQLQSTIDRQAQAVSELENVKKNLEGTPPAPASKPGGGRSSSSS